MRKNIHYIYIIAATVLLTLLFHWLFIAPANNDSIGLEDNPFWISSSKRAHMLLNNALSRESHFAWGTGNHTASPIPTGAVGPQKYINKLNGLIHNTDIGKVSHQAINDGMNVILVIGDGMGINHMSLPIYMRIAENSKEKTYFEKILNEGSCGITLNNPVGGLVTGSATSATSIATGIKSYLEVVSVDTNGFPIKTSLELAKENNYSTAIITDAGITDGTPAAFYAHSYNRDLENSIVEQLINSKVDVIFGGGAKRFIPNGTNLKDYKYFSDSENTFNANSARKDDKNLLLEFEDNGYKIISSKTDLVNLDKNTDRVLGLFAPGGLSAAIDRDNEETGEPSLVQMTEKTIKMLKNKKRKYFMMIEAGRIDWEAHDNDAGAVYRAMEEMNSILKVCYEEYQKNKKNTLLIFTADHETGGLSISYTKVSNQNQFSKKMKSGDDWFSLTDPLLFENFRKLKNQKRAIHRDFGEAKSVKGLYEMLNDNLDYDVTFDEAEIIYNTKHDYKKGK
jgi:alkaline phosphatase